MNNKVVVTGLGIISPIGNTIQKFLSSLKSGKNGINKITLFDTSNHKVKIAGESLFSLEDHFTSKELNKLDRFTIFGLLAADQAIKQANLNNKYPDVGVIIGSGIGGIGTF